MLTAEDADSLIEVYLNLKANKKKSKEDFNKFQKHERICVEKFKYIVTAKLNRYRSFSNYEDLMQEGFLALLNAFDTFNPNKKGNIFWWIHRYTDTRIARRANLHTTIRFPLKYAKQFSPHRESILPTLVDNVSGPHDILEHTQHLNTIRQNFDKLSSNQQKVVNMIFGMNDDNPQSISKVCKKLRMSRPTCTKILDQALNILRRNVHL